MSKNREENKNTLYIPVNIKTRFEFFSGFGFAELTVTALITACSIITAILIPNIDTGLLQRGFNYSNHNNKGGL